MLTVRLLRIMYLAKTAGSSVGLQPILFSTATQIAVPTNTIERPIMKHEQALDLAREGFTLLRHLLQKSVWHEQQVKKKGFFSIFVVSTPNQYQDAALELAEALHNLNPTNEFCVTLTRNRLKEFVEKYPQYQTDIVPFI